MDAMHDEMAPNQLTCPTGQHVISHSNQPPLASIGHHDLGAALRMPINPIPSAVAGARPCPPPDGGICDEVPQQTLTPTSSSAYLMFRRPRYPADANVFLSDLPNELLLHILGYLDVNDLLSTSRVGFPTHCISDNF